MLTLTELKILIHDYIEYIGPVILSILFCILIIYIVKNDVPPKPNIKEQKYDCPFHNGE